jgi:hypothetical protein
MQTTSEEIASILERIDKAREVNQARIDALEAEDKLLDDAHTLITKLDIKMDKMRENLQ